MSIIHDALKKLQQGLPPKTDQKKSTNPFEWPAELETLPPSDPQANGQKKPLQNKIKSVLALLCAFAITLGTCVFLYQQMHRYFPKIEKLAMSPIEQLVHQIGRPPIKTKPPENLPPLVQITVNPPKPKITSGPVIPSAIPGLPKPAPGVTLDIHGVMSNGPNNLVLINDQIYQEGDDIDGVKIIKINLDYITVDNNGKVERIRVNN